MVAGPMLHIFMFAVQQRASAFTGMEAQTTVEEMQIFIMRDIRGSSRIQSAGQGLEFLDSSGNTINYTLNGNAQLLRSVNGRGSVVIAAGVTTSQFSILESGSLLSYHFTIQNQQSVMTAEGVVSRRVGR